MNLNTPNFLFLFLPVFIFLYSLFKRKGKFIVGIVGSLVFYSWGNLVYIPLIIGLVLFTYMVGRLINSWHGTKTALIVLWISIFINLALVIGFKLQSSIAYPLGLSYLTFQAIAYFVEVNKSVAGVENNLLKFSFYLLMFPKIPVGPIVKYSSIRQQLVDINPTAESIANGLRRFLRGFIKKTLIADTIGTVVSPIFNLTSPIISPSIAWLVIISYSLQLFFDFSGYTDMALGIAGMMGFQLPENFNYPYLSKNISDFWRRWHMTLSSWFREIVFYPLERRRLKWLGQPINILIVFILTGLWHGLSKNFLIWGGIHGLALVFEGTSVGRKFRTIWPPVQYVYTLGIILIGWVFFRSATPGFALDFIKRLLGDTSGLQILPFEVTSPLPIIETTFLMAITFAVLLCFPLGLWFQKKISVLTKQRPYLQLPLQIFYDVGLIIVFILAIASAAGAAYYPGIYGAF